MPVYIGNRVALGACQSGCIGIADSASLVCILERENSLQSVIGKECNSNNSCVTGECKVIGDQAVCADVQKSSLLLVFFLEKIRAYTLIFWDIRLFRTALCLMQAAKLNAYVPTDFTELIAHYQWLPSRTWCR